MALGHDPLGALKRASHLRIVGRFLGIKVRFSQNRFGLLAGHDLRAAEHNDRGIDVMFAEHSFSFEHFELHAQGTIFLALEKIDVDLGEQIAGRFEDRQPVGRDIFRKPERGFVECIGRGKFSFVNCRVVDRAGGIVCGWWDLTGDGLVGHVRSSRADQFGGRFFVSVLMVTL